MAVPEWCPGPAWHCAGGGAGASVRRTALPLRAALGQVQGARNTPRFHHSVDSFGPCLDGTVVARKEATGVLGQDAQWS